MYNNKNEREAIHQPDGMWTVLLLAKGIYLAFLNKQNI